MRTSRNILRPTISTMKEIDAYEKVKNAKLIFEKTLLIDREYANSFKMSYINYRVYNKKAKKEKENGSKCEKHLNPF